MRMQADAVDISAAQFIAETVNAHPGQARCGFESPKTFLKTAWYRLSCLGCVCTAPCFGAVCATTSQCRAHVRQHSTQPYPYDDCRYAIQPNLHKFQIGLSMLRTVAGRHPSAGVTDQHCPGATAGSVPTPPVAGTDRHGRSLWRQRQRQPRGGGQRIR